MAQCCKNSTNIWKGELGSVSPPGGLGWKDHTYQSDGIRKNSSRVIPTADKGMAMVVMDRQDYINKAQHLLDDRDTYRSITLDPTSRLKNKLILTLRNIKTTGGLNDFQ